LKPLVVLDGDVLGRERTGEETYLANLLRELPALAPDLRLAAADSSFGIPAAKLGIAYVFDMTRQLVQPVGPAHARMLLYSGIRVDGAEAARIGLVQQAVPAEHLEGALREAGADAQNRCVSELSCAADVEANGARALHLIADAGADEFPRLQMVQCLDQPARRTPSLRDRNSWVSGTRSSAVTSTSTSSFDEGRRAASRERQPGAPILLRESADL